MQVTLDIPDELVTNIEQDAKAVERAVLELALVEGYRTGALTESTIKRLLGYGTRMQVHALLAEHNVPLNYSLEDWEHDKRMADERAARRLAARATAA